MPKRSHRNYITLQLWRIVKETGSIAVVPSLRRGFIAPLIPLPGLALLWWLLHGVIEITTTDRFALLLANGILIGTPLLIAVIVLVSWAISRKGGLPYLEATGHPLAAELPRHEIRFHATDDRYTFVHDHFIDESRRRPDGSEFNLVLNSDTGEICYPILKSIGFSRTFDQLGADLKDAGFRFATRTTHER